ncbi:hypothetical protein [Tahibacter harae]|uniref:Glycosyl hydrolase n=1 Tax=Tahibacter harae TaxID=2963937 RepID=A0ABT1QTR7_9GAMM|nr:hypothetical protein [Tahibacter harae]MCQ4165666.1 hypothetical protein [Tahibacter harae]
MPRTLLISALLLLALPVLASAQGQGPLIPGDKTFGESLQQEKRRRWFNEVRNLEHEPDAALYRSEALVQQQEVLARRTPQYLTVAPRWQSMGPSPMTMTGWTFGKVSGRILSFAVRSGDDNIQYLGSASGGLWKTVDGGDSWLRLSDELDSQAIGALLLVNGATPAADELWVGTGDFASGCYDYFGSGLYRSTDAGLTFQPRNGSGANTLKLSTINAIARRPGQPQTLLVAGAGQCVNGSVTATSGIYRTTDNGLNWTRVVSSGRSMDVRFDRNDGNIAWAAVNGVGVLKSTDGGVTWATSRANTSAKIRLATADSNSNIVYMYTSGGAIDKTSDGGATWASMATGACDGQCSYNLTIDVDPANPSRIMVGAIRPYLSSDSGATRTAMTTTWGSTQSVHQDIHHVYFSRNSSTRLWIGSDGGLWRSNDGGATFTHRNDGLTLTQFYDIALDRRDPDRMLGGAQDNSSLARSTSNVWFLTRTTGDGFMNLSAPDDGANNGRYTFQTSYPSSDLPNISRSSNYAGLYGGAISYSSVSTSGLVAGGYQWVTAMTVTKGYVFVGGNSVFRMPVTGSSWSSTGSAFASPVAVFSDPDPSGTAPLRLYAGTTGGKVYTTSNALPGGPDWTDISAGLNGARITDIATEHGNASTVYVTVSTFTNTKLYKSTNAGASWTPVGSGLPGVTANSVIVDTANPLRVFVGTDIGVYESTDGGATFAPMTLGMPRASVVLDLEIAANPHVLVAGLYGGGAWKISLDPDLDTIFVDGFEQ